ncbi:MAG: thiamine pyrophosphate-binding protein [Rhizobiaceae bacterium]|nr:thiamine pyrophosphate-binding protein [Rhizobiaceae bacterium]
MVDSFTRHCGGRFISAAHEAGAVLMALGYSLISGKVSVSSVTYGPGVTNTITALVEGVKGSTPMVLLCGDTDVLDRQNPQNISQREFIAVTGAGFEPIRSADTAAEDIARAFVAPSSSGGLSLRTSPMISIGRMSPTSPLWSVCATVAASEDLDNAIGMISAAKRPVIVAGRGAASPGAKVALLRLAERIGAPVATTLKGKDLFAGEPFNLGIMGTARLPARVDVILASDCIIAFGASLNDLTISRGTFAKEKRIIQINQDPTAISKNVVANAGLVGDCAEVTDLIVHWLDEAEIPLSEFRSPELAERLAAQFATRSPIADNGDGTVDFRDALHQLDRILPCKPPVRTAATSDLQRA